MTVHIKSVIDDFFKIKKKEFEVSERICRILNEFLDEETKKHVRFNKLSKNNLILHSDSSSFTYNFNLTKERLLKKIKADFPNIKDIKVVIG